MRVMDFEHALGGYPYKGYSLVLPEAFGVGITCGVVDLLPLTPLVLLGFAFAWQAFVGFR